MIHRALSMVPAVYSLGRFVTRGYRRNPFFKLEASTVRYVHTTRYESRNFAMLHGLLLETERILGFVSGFVSIGADTTCHIVIIHPMSQYAITKFCRSRAAWSVASARWHNRPGQPSVFDREVHHYKTYRLRHLLYSKLKLGLTVV